MKTIVHRLAEFGLFAALLGAVFALGPPAEAQKGGGGKPPTPTGLTAVAGVGTVALSWNASTGATNYKVKRSTVSGKSYSVIATPTITGYTDGNVAGGTTYYYVVSAVNQYGESSNSAQVSATPQAAPPDPAIAFNLRANGRPYVMNANGDWPIELAAYRTSPMAFSPNGMRIAFLASDNAPQGRGLYVADRDGQNLVRIRPVDYDSPVVSKVDWALMPDGIERIAYEDVLAGGDFPTVLLTDLAGTELRDLNDSLQYPYGLCSPSFSGDGTKLLVAKYGWPEFVEVRYETLFGFLTEAGRTNHPLASFGAPFTSGSWDITSLSASRTGNKLAISADEYSHNGNNRYNWRADLFVVDLDNPTSALRLTNTSGEWEECPTWSPDDTKIAFSVYSGPIRMIPSGGGAVTSIGTTSGVYPYWRRQP